MKFEGIAFNEKWIESLPGEDAFMQEMSGEGYSHIFPNDPNREAKLKQVYALAAKKDVVVAKPARKKKAVEIPAEQTEPVAEATTEEAQKEG